MQSSATGQYRMIYDIYVLLDDGDRRVLRPFNLSISQYNVLLLLDSDDGWRLTDLSERLLLDKSTVTRIIDRLELMGLVQRRAEPGDRRAQRVVINEQGRALRERARAAHEHSMEHRMAVLAPEEQRSLYGLLAKLRDGLQTELHHAPTQEP